MPNKTRNGTVEREGLFKGMSDADIKKIKAFAAELRVHIGPRPTTEELSSAIREGDMDTGLTPIEDLFDAISEGDIDKVNTSIKNGASMRIKINGMYPLQRAMLAEGMVDEKDSKKDMNKIFSIIEEASKAVGIVYEGQNIVDKAPKAKDRGFLTSPNQNPKRGGVAPTR